ncbi:MAG: cytochrome c biogenesis protein ResB [Pyrinomonadaceae bacterium]|nr:cytochrome c biogenesis protein ResB [Pyrinomonadaceae bacterium]
MSASEETINTRPSAKQRTVPILNRVINFLSSVRFGVVLLCILVALSMIGMLIVQQNVQGFDAYFASLTPAERTVFGALGFFDIYHSWYYNVLLLILSLNIVLASIEHFPSAWKYITQPKTKATREWLLVQKAHAVLTVDGQNEDEIAASVSRQLAKYRYKPQTNEVMNLVYPVDENGNKVFSTPLKRFSKVVFGETGKFNRLGAYWVHVALLTLFLGHFVALQTGFDADVRMIPGDATDQIQMIQFDLDKKEKFNVQLPFTMTCTDIQQRLIDPRGGIDVSNTLDWRTQLRIDDPEYGSFTADVSMNKPFDYRGYRFFQAQTIPVGNARRITLDITPISGGETQKIEIPRLGTAQLPDGTFIEYTRSSCLTLRLVRTASLIPAPANITTRSLFLALRLRAVFVNASLRSARTFPIICR